MLKTCTSEKVDKISVSIETNSSSFAKSNLVFKYHQNFASKFYLVFKMISNLCHTSCETKAR